MQRWLRAVGDNSKSAFSQPTHLSSSPSESSDSEALRKLKLSSACSTVRLVLEARLKHSPCFCLWEGNLKRCQTFKIVRSSFGPILDQRIFLTALLLALLRLSSHVQKEKTHTKHSMSNFQTNVLRGKCLKVMAHLFI